MKKLQTEKNLQKKKSHKKIIFFLTAVFMVLCALRIFVANRLVDASHRLYSLENQQAELSVENEQLAAILSQETSLGNLALRAKEAGFVENSKVVFAKSSPPVALKLP